MQDKRKAEALRLILGIGGTGLGLGMGARGLMGLKNMFSQRSTTPALSSSIPAEMPIPVVRHRPRDDEDSRLKIGSFEAVANALAEEDSSNTPLEDLSREFSKEADTAGQTLRSALPDIPNPDPRYAWWTIPTAVGVGSAGLMGGWSLLDKLLKSRKDSNLEGDVDDAERDYRKALAEQYRAGMLTKHAEDLDAVHAAVTEEKQAGLFDNNTAQGAMGGYLTALLGIGALSGYGTYKWAKGRNRNKLLEKAMKLRARRRNFAQPIYATPRPIDLADDETETNV